MQKGNYVETKCAWCGEFLNLPIYKITSHNFCNSEHRNKWLSSSMNPYKKTGIDSEIRNQHRKEYQKKYQKKYHQNPEVKKIIQKRIKEKYKNDNEFREKCLLYHKRKRNENPEKNWINRSLKKHEKKGHIINISIDEILPNLPKQCPICKVELDYKSSNRSGYKASLDRINNQKHIDKNNLMIVCHRCNTTKSSRTSIEMFDWCKKYILFYESLKKIID